MCTVADSRYKLTMRPSILHPHISTHVFSVTRLLQNAVFLQGLNYKMEYMPRNHQGNVDFCSCFAIKEFEIFVTKSICMLSVLSKEIATKLRMDEEMLP